MVFDIANDSHQEICFIIAVVGVALAITATLLRFVAVRLAHRRPRWDDWFAIWATFFLILYVMPLIYPFPAYHKMNKANYDDLKVITVLNGKPISSLTKEEVVRVKKAGYSLGPQFCLQQLFAKLSLLFLYYNAFYVSQNFVYCLYALGIIQTCWSIATFLAHLFECTPVQKLWTPSLPGHCINSQAFLAAGETPNSLIDFALIGLAVWMVHSVRLKTAVKIKLTCIFIIGGLAGILGFVKIAYGFGAISANKVELLDPIWATVQQTCSVICCCAPVYKPLIPDFGLGTKISSLSSSVFPKSPKSGAQTPMDGNGGIPQMICAGGIFKHTEDWAPLDEHSRRLTASTLVEK